MAKGKRFEVWAKNEKNEWGQDAAFADLAGADGHVRNKLIGRKNTVRARIVDVEGEHVPSEWNCVPVNRNAA